jgi:hypothetical protein
MKPRCPVLGWNLRLMVRFDPRRWSVAAGPPAASVAGVECFADPVWNDTVGSAYFEG